jgi:hypothetical protein
MPAASSDSKVCIFRPAADAWLGRVILPAAFIAVLAVTALNLLDSNPGLQWLVLAMLPSIGLVAGVYAIPILLGRIRVDRGGLWANVDGMRLSLPWKEVRALRLSIQEREPYLEVGVGSGLVVVPIHHFKTRKVWESIENYAPAEALRQDAFDYYERKDALEGVPPDLWMVGVLRVADNRGLAVAASLGAVGFLLLFAITLVKGLPGAPVYLAFSALYVIALLGIGSTELDLGGITRRTPLGVMRIGWDELESVEMGPFGLRMALEGMRMRRMVFFGPSMWVGPDAPRAVRFLALQISTRRLPRRRTLLALFKISRNTRIEGGE